MKILNVNTEVRTANVLQSASIELTEREIRFIVGANRRLDYLLHNSPRENSIIADSAMDEIAQLSHKLSHIVCPKLEEVLLTIDEQFLHEFDPYYPEEPSIDLRKGKTKYDMQA